MLRLFSAICVLACFSVSTQINAQPAYKKPSDIPVEVFAALPNFSNPKLSPDGSKIAYFIEREGRNNIVIQDLITGKPSLVGPHDDAEYWNFYWKSNDVILLKMSLTLKRIYFRGKSTETRMLSFNLTTRDFKWLAKPKSKTRGEHTSVADRMIDLLHDDPDHVLMELDFDVDGTPSVFKVNVRTGRRKTVKNGRKGINDWYADQNAEIRLGTGYKSRSAEYNMTYKTADGEWIDLKKLSWTDHYDIESFAPEPDMLYVSGKTKHGTDGIMKLHVISGTIVDEIASYDGYDIDGVYLHPVTERLAGVYFRDDFQRIKYFDQKLALIQRSVNAVMPNTINSIVSKARDRELYLIKARSDQNPGDYFFYDREKKTMGYFASMRKALDPRLMASTEMVSIPVRNNRTIPGYLTIPHANKAKGLPTIILPHGGPQSRDTAEWDYKAQFFASRGWLVLKPNFRGSTGYGEAFEEAGEKQWGGLMQDDVTDATRWLIKEGMADPDRICIVGSSYGGYAALFGTIKEPASINAPFQQTALPIL